jgi:sulfhydrogenase subunit beta (sulfur reductase)
MPSGPIADESLLSPCSTAIRRKGSDVLPAFDTRERPMPHPSVGTSPAVLEATALDPLLEALRARGFTAVGPRVREGAIVYDEISSAADLPAGWTDEQDAGSYRLKESGDKAVFGAVVGPHSWKRFLHPSELRLWQVRRQGEEFDFVEESKEPPRLAFVGVRPCEIAAIRVQDKVFLEGTIADPHYRSRREGIFIVAVNCTRPGGTCFCASMGTGPGADGGFDIVLTEFLDGADVKGGHRFVAEAGSTAGEEVLKSLPAAQAGEAEVEAARSAVRAAAGRMGRTLERDGLKEILSKSLEHPRWDAVADRCLACGNCTLVCPTCFCTTVEDTTDITGANAERRRKWDSCFSMEFSYIYGGHIRRTVRARYRQWLTHKLSTWEDQFGTSGCVGCGRCIAWCPAAIDITEEARAIRENQH